MLLAFVPFVKTTSFLFGVLGPTLIVGCSGGDEAPTAERNSTSQASTESAAVAASSTTSQAIGVSSWEITNDSDATIVRGYDASKALVATFRYVATHDNGSTFAAQLDVGETHAKMRVQSADDTDVDVLEDSFGGDSTASAVLERLTADMSDDEASNDEGTGDGDGTGDGTDGRLTTDAFGLSPKPSSLHGLDLTTGNPTLTNPCTPVLVGSAANASKTVSSCSGKSSCAQSLKSTSSGSAQCKSTGIKILPLGASVTAGWLGTNAGYRGYLHTMLDKAGVAHQFVGSQTSFPGSLPANETHHEGHPGFRIDQITSGVGGWLSGVKPDYILILVGSNDVAQNYDLAHAGDRMGALLSKISGLAPKAHVIVSSVPRINDANQEKLAVAYNATIRAVAGAHGAGWVDAHAVVTPADKADNLHPNDSGYAKIASLWKGALGH